MTKSADHTPNPNPHAALRERTEAALDSGDLKTAKELAAQLEKYNLGPWDNILFGRIALASDLPKDARSHFLKAQEALPNEGAVLVHLASAHAALRKWPQAIECMEDAISQRGDIAELHERHGIYLANAEKLDESVWALNRAIDLEPRRSTAWALLGERRLEKNDIPGAEGAFTKAVMNDPDSPSGLWNLSLLAERRGDLDRAIEILTRQSERGVDSRRALHRRGLINLSRRNFGQGWTDYAARLKNNKEYWSWQHAMKAPYWAGEDLSSKHLVVWADQGLGEQILTAGLAREAIDRVGALTFACDPRLVALLQRSFPKMSVVSLEQLRDDGQSLRPADMQASLSELGAVLRPDMACFPDPQAFLIPDAKRVSEYRAQLSSRYPDRPLIGMSWRSKNPIVGDQKSSDLNTDWLEFFKAQPFGLVSLQYGDTTEELASIKEDSGIEIATVPDLNLTNDIDGFAALVAAMDVVISTSNTAVHMAGGLGRPTVAMIPQGYGRPWYWFDDGETSPWYGDITLLRSQGDWTEVLREASARMESKLAV